MRVTINDIAKAANVSPSTVSRAIADSPRISKATKKKIFKIMEEMNYYPNVIARSLARKATNIIGILVMGTTEKAFQHPFFPEILRGVASVAYKSNYKILISSVTNMDEQREIVDDLTQSGITDGIILLSSGVKDPSISYLKEIHFPFVIVGRPDNENEANWVDNDNVSVGYQMTRHLIEMGCTEIAFLGVDPKFIVTLDRLKGYKMALQDNNIPINEDLIIEGKFVDDTGYDLMKKLADRGMAPSGVIACDDLLAFGVIKYLKEKGLRVPDDVAVAGFNNVPLSSYFTPPLTSVDINAFSLGAKGFELLMACMKSEYKSFNRAIIPAQLIIRESTMKKRQ